MLLRLWAALAVLSSACIWRVNGGMCNKDNIPQLIALYHATDGPNWARNDGWLSGIDEDEDEEDEDEEDEDEEDEDEEDEDEEDEDEEDEDEDEEDEDEDEEDEDEIECSENAGKFFTNLRYFSVVSKQKKSA